MEAIKQPPRQLLKVKKWDMLRTETVHKRTIKQSEVSREKNASKVTVL